MPEHLNILFKKEIFLAGGKKKKEFFSKPNNLQASQI